MSFQVANTSGCRAYQVSFFSPVAGPSCFTIAVPFPCTVQIDPQIGFKNFESLFRASPVHYCSFHLIGSDSLQNGLEYIRDTFAPSEKTEFFRQCLENRLEDIVQLLIDSQIVDLSMKDNWNRTILFHSVVYGVHWLVEKILQRAGSFQLLFVNEQDRLGNTPLLLAVQEGCVQCTHILVRAGANWEVANFQGHTPLNFAFSNALPLLKTCVEKNLVVISPAFLNHYYQLEPIQRKAFEFINLILELTKMQPSCCKFFYFSLLLDSHDHELAKAMVEKGVISPLEQDASGFTLLHHAVTKNNMTMVDFLVGFYQQTGVNLDISDIYRCTALHWACMRGDRSCVEILILNKADYEKLDERCLSPLMLLLISNFPLGKNYLLKMKQKGYSDFTPYISAYHALHPYDRHEMNQIFPMKALIHIKRLAQIWGINGKTQWNGIQMTYEGYDPSVMRKLFFDAMRKFLITFPQAECYRHLRKKVGTFFLADRASSQEIGQRIAQGEPIICTVRLPTHVSYLLIMNGHLYLCDRGRLRLGSGVISSKISQPVNLLKSLETIRALKTTEKLLLYVSLGLFCDLGLDRVDCIPQKIAKAGNCTAGSAKSLLLAVLFAEALHQGIPRQEAKQIAYGTYKRFTGWVRIHSLQYYLQEGGGKDIQLLGAIKQKLCDPTRLQPHFPNIAMRADAVRDIQKEINSAAEDED